MCLYLIGKISVVQKKKIEKEKKEKQRHISVTFQFAEVCIGTHLKLIL